MNNFGRIIVNLNVIQNTRLLLLPGELHYYIEIASLQNKHPNIAKGFLANPKYSNILIQRCAKEILQENYPQYCRSYLVRQQEIDYIKELDQSITMSKIEKVSIHITTNVFKEYKEYIDGNEVLPDEMIRNKIYKTYSWLTNVLLDKFKRFSRNFFQDREGQITNATHKTMLTHLREPWEVFKQGVVKEMDNIIIYSSPTSFKEKYMQEAEEHPCLARL